MGMLQRIIEFMTASLRISNKIHPVPRPLFTEMNAAQQTLDDPFVRIRGWISKELIDFLNTGRKSSQVVAYAAQPSPFVRLLGGNQTVGLESSTDEAIDFTEVLALDNRYFALGNGTPTPVFAYSFLYLKGRSLRRGGQLWCRLIRPRSPL